MYKYSLSLALLFASMLYGQSEDAQTQFNKQVQVRRDEAKAVVKTYLELFKAGSSVQGLNQLGVEYLKQSKPIQAQAIFKNALTLDANSETLKANLTTSTEIIDKKNTMMANFETTEKMERNPQHACSRAAILFHLGFMGDAVDLLSDAEERYAGSPDVSGLLNTFKMGIAVDTVVVKNVLREFADAIAAKDQERAVSCLAEYQFFSLGTGDPTKLVEMIGETFGAEIKTKIQEILARTAA